MSRKKTGSFFSCGVPCTCFLYGDHKEEKRRSPGTITTRWSWHAGFVLRLHTVTRSWPVFPALFDHLALLILMERVPNVHSLTSVETSVVTPFRRHSSCPICILGAGGHASFPPRGGPSLAASHTLVPLHGAAHRAPAERCSICHNSLPSKAKGAARP